MTQIPAKLQPGANIMADNDEIHQIPIKNLISEDGAHELAESADMEPYVNFAMALMQGNDPAPELKAIRRLPSLSGTGRKRQIICT